MAEKSIYENGAIHLDRHKELHLGKVTESSLRSLMHDFFADDAEDADIIGEVTSGLAEIQENLKELKASHKIVVSDVSTEELIRQSIAQLMEARVIVKKGGKELEEPLFNQQNHWQAVYRILVDKRFCNDSDFDGFDLFINKVMPPNVNAPYKKASVKQISQTDFNKPFDKWKFDAETSGTRRPFERMNDIALCFLDILTEKGL